MSKRKPSKRSDERTYYPRRREDVVDRKNKKTRPFRSPDEIAYTTNRDRRIDRRTLRDLDNVNAPHVRDGRYLYRDHHAYVGHRDTSTTRARDNRRFASVRLVQQRPKTTVASMNMSPVANIRRRVDSLDGLRAICALAVVGYHMGFSWLSGGLLGVTVLFVLSGYLATNSILSESVRNKGTVDIGDYYQRRLRRLAPQAIACVVITTALCVVFDHVLLTKLRPDVLPSLLMYLNWSKIISKVSYFAAAGAPSPLTHFWSLAIEWQFFLVWPLILAFLVRRHAPGRPTRIVLLVLAAVSAALMALLYVPGKDPSRAYYGTDTRVMSLLVGCWLALLWPLRDASSIDLSKDDTHRVHAELAGTVTLVTLIVLMVVTKGYTSFSYYGGVALVSILTTIALAALLPAGTIISRVLSVRPLVWIGERSYALYLWHYPIILLLTKRNSTVATPIWRYVLWFVLSLIAADVSYRLIERPFGRRGYTLDCLREFIVAARERVISQWLGIRAFKIVPVLAVLVIAIVGLAVIPDVQAVGTGEDNTYINAASLRKSVPDGVYDIVLIGDSVPLDAYDEISSVFPYALIDCAISRQMSSGIDILQGYVDKGVVGDTVICCLGSNGELTQSQLQQFLDIAGTDRTVWFVNNRMPDNFQDANNTLIASFVNEHDNAEQIDWYGYSTGHDDWFWDDGEHVTPDGANAYAQMLLESTDYVVPTLSNTTYSTVFLGDSVAASAIDELADISPTGVVNCAQGRNAGDAREALEGYLDQGVVGANVVLAVGTDSIISQKDIEDIVDDIGDDRQLYLVNTRTNAQWQQDNNTLLADIADAYDNVHLIDWYAASEGHDEYFSGDGVMLSTDGIPVYTSLIEQAVGDSTSDASGTTKS